MSLNPNLTQDEAKWLAEEFGPKASWIRVDGHSMDTLFLKARRLITGNMNIGKPSCGCEFKTFAQVTTSMYEQYENEIKAIAYPPVKKTTRGRKAKI